MLTNETSAADLVAFVEQRVFQDQAELAFDDLVPLATVRWGKVSNLTLVWQLHAPETEVRMLPLADRLSLLVHVTYIATTAQILDAWQKFLETVESIDFSDMIASVVVPLCRDKMQALA